MAETGVHELPNPIRKVRERGTPYERREQTSDEAGMACFKADLALGWVLRDTVIVPVRIWCVVMRPFWWIFVSYLLFACGRLICKRLLVCIGWSEGPIPGVRQVVVDDDRTAIQGRRRQRRDNARSGNARILVVSF